MSLTVIPARSKQEFDQFMDLPWSLYERGSLWTPGLKSQDRELLTPGEHPFWESARRELFLVLRDGRAIGRIAAIVDEKYNAYANEKCGAFGFFECANDPEAAHALLDAAHGWLAKQGMRFMRGPLNPSANYTCGLLVHGFDLAPTIMMPWNPPYYAELLETWHLRKEQDLFAYQIERSRLTPPEWLSEEVTRLKAEARFTCRTSSKATLAEDIRAMLELYKVSWAKNWGFSPLSDGEAEQHVKELKSVLDPEFFVLFFHNNQPAAGMVALPDMAPLLRRLNGKLGISALWHWWQSRAEIRGGYRIILFGIREEFRLMGLPLLLLDFMLEKARQHPHFQWVEGSWVLEDNTPVNDLLEDFSGQLTKRYRIYRREIQS
ncbi:hypothetical protein JMF94_00060 [Desulfovibrio sp. UIB00]|uniref:hypothetical protein n=1 Tax=Desulfovibrio sp. UIB00 TaxID=2804314 RepID=UPI001F0D17D2|nr:hypothetical protein [Desulfovibrio sp. UIB00]MCH5143473.1 hypothetical protein [Desulfovibrio sp. UIB00]